jgi:hypothetical protein
VITRRPTFLSFAIAAMLSTQVQADCAADVDAAAMSITTVGPEGITVEDYDQATVLLDIARSRCDQGDDAAAHAKAAEALAILGI